MGVGTSFMTGIELIYSVQEAEIYMEGFESRGVRQGCPLSPLLFNLMIQTLASAFKVHNGIRGVQTPQREHRLSLYMNDILFFVHDPVNSVKMIVQVL